MTRVATSAARAPVAGAEPARRLPGFDLVRILAAASVIFSHSFLLADGTEANEPVRARTGLILGLYGVFVFFILSGYLVSESRARSPSVASYLTKRVRRVFPGFVVCNLALVVLLCPFFAIGSGREFLASGATWRHLAEVLSFRQSSLMYSQVEFYPLHGPDDFLPQVVNGVLWTIRQELTCYAFVAAMMWVRAPAWLAAGVAVALSIVPTIFLGLQVNEFVGGLAFVAPGFAAGMALYGVARQHRARGWIAGMSAGALFLAAITLEGWGKAGHIGFPMLGSYPLLWLGQRNWPFLHRLARFGDPSYGIYLWGYPVQQTVRALLGEGVSALGLTAICLPIAIAFGYASWHLVEARFLRSKPPFDGPGTKGVRTSALLDRSGSR